jgi:DNA ligase (NAD+)
MGIPGNPKDRIDFLAAELRRHQDLYYKKAMPEISDREYDRLFEELLALEKKHPDLAGPDSPTKRVGSDLEKDFPEVPHPRAMLSLDKVYTKAELGEWMEKMGRETAAAPSFVIEDKVDGSTIVLHYENGVLVRAVTRGDGLVGNDITDNVKTIRDIPLRLTEPVTAHFRGEIYIDKDDFERLNREVDNIYANPRNFAAGSLRRKKSSEVARVPLRSFVYEGTFGTEHIELLARLSRLGFRVSDAVGFFGAEAGEGGRYASLGAEHPEWVIGTVSRAGEFVDSRMRARKTVKYEADGLVVKLNDLRDRERLGSTTHHPRWAVAFKYEAPQSVSEITGIEVQVGRTGRVTPVARIKPVRISGSTVSNVTLHNQDYIDSLEAAVGDRVSVSRRGDVIPAVDEVVEKNDMGNPVYRLPPDCPSCGTALTREGAHTFCPNRNCPARVYGRAAFFVGRGQMDIENLGPETVKRLLEIGLIKDVPDLYFFDPNALLGVEGFGEKKVALIREGIEKSKSRPYASVLASLGLDEIGPRAADLLIESGYDSIDLLLDAAHKRDPEAFTRVEGIGPKIAERIIDQLNDPAILGMIGRLRQAGLCFARGKPGISPAGPGPEGKPGAPSAEPGLPRTFKGEVWCVTGSFERFKPREKAMEEVVARGGKHSPSVTGKTTHLLAGAQPGGKLQKAKKLGVRIVSEAEFLAWLRGQGP